MVSRIPRRVLAASGCLALAAAVVLATACGKAEVAELSVEPGVVTLPHGGWTVVRFTLRPASPLPAGVTAPHLFVHLRDDAGVLRTFDQPLRGTWTVGESLVQDVRLHQSAVAPPLAAGEYALTAGLYQPGGDRLRLDSTAPQSGKAEYRVATVTVPATPPSFTAAFGEGVGPFEPGADRQIVGRRWIGSAGVVTLGGLDGPGTLWVQLRVPAPVPGESTLELAGEADQQHVELATNCSDARAGLAGAGVHELDLRVPAPQPGCELRATPNFRLVRSGAPDQGVALEIVAWRADADAAVPAAAP